MKKIPSIIILFLTLFEVGRILNAYGTTISLAYFEEHLFQNEQILATEDRILMEEHALYDVETKSGWKFFGNTHMAHVDEPLDESTRRSYTTGSLRIGVQHALLATRQREKQAIKRAKLRVKTSRFVKEETMAKTLLEIRRNYSDYWVGYHLLHLTNQILESEAFFESRLPLWQEKGILLESDRAQLMKRFHQTKKKRSDSCKHRKKRLLI